MIFLGIFDKLLNLKIIIGYLGEMVLMFLNRMDNIFGYWIMFEWKIFDYYWMNVYVILSGLLY